MRGMKILTTVRKTLSLTCLGIGCGLLLLPIWTMYLLGTMLEVILMLLYAFTNLLENVSARWAWMMHWIEISE